MFIIKERPVYKKSLFIFCSFAILNDLSAQLLLSICIQFAAFILNATVYKSFIAEASMYSIQHFLHKMHILFYIIETSFAYD